MIRSARAACGQHGQQTNRTITHNDDSLVGAYLGGDRAEPAPRALEAMRVDSLLERCPSCGRASPFRKGEYR
jgi:hypothetical protein